jgi:hypothetical protein
MMQGILGGSMFMLVLFLGVKLDCVADISEERVATIFWVISTLKMLIQIFGISVHFHAVPAFDNKIVFCLFNGLFCFYERSLQLLIFDHLNYLAQVQFYGRHVLYIAYL